MLSRNGATREGCAVFGRRRDGERGDEEGRGERGRWEDEKP